MKKKVKTNIKKRPIISTNKRAKKDIHTTVKKVLVGEDEFCPTCMEWRAYDETTGKCTVCGRQIKKAGARSHTVTDEYDLKDFTIEHDEQPENPEN
jgi:hypothetical protein